MQFLVRIRNYRSIGRILGAGKFRDGKPRSGPDNEMRSNRARWTDQVSLTRSVLISGTDRAGAYTQGRRPIQTPQMATLKRNKPRAFSGENYTTADVNSWIFKIRAYVKSSRDEEEKVEVAAGYLSGTADKWFIAKYSRGPLPTFEEILLRKVSI